MLCVSPAGVPGGETSSSEESTTGTVTAVNKPQAHLFNKQQKYLLSIFDKGTFGNFEVLKKIAIGK